VAWASGRTMEVALGMFITRKLPAPMFSR